MIWLFVLSEFSGLFNLAVVFDEFGDVVLGIVYACDWFMLVVAWVRLVMFIWHCDGLLLRCFESFILLLVGCLIVLGIAFVFEFC